MTKKKKNIPIGIYLYIYLYLYLGHTQRSPGLSCCLWPLETWLYPLVEHISAALHRSLGSQTCFQSLMQGPFYPTIIMQGPYFYLCKVLLPISSRVVHKYILCDFGECCKSVPLDRPGSYVSISIKIYITIILAHVVQVDAFLL